MRGECKCTMEEPQEQPTQSLIYCLIGTIVIDTVIRSVCRKKMTVGKSVQLWRNGKEVHPLKRGTPHAGIVHV